MGCSRSKYGCVMPGGRSKEREDFPDSFQSGVTIWDSLRYGDYSVEDSIEEVGWDKASIAHTYRTWSMDTASQSIGSYPRNMDLSHQEVIEIEEMCRVSEAHIVELPEIDNNRERFRSRRGSLRLSQWESYDTWNEKRMDAELLLSNAKRLADTYVPNAEKLADDKYNEKRIGSEVLLNKAKNLADTYAPHASLSIPHTEYRLSEVMEELSC